MIKVRKIENGVLTITMNDIVSQIPDIKDYNWKLVWIEGISSQIDKLHLPNGIKYMRELMETVNNSSSGYFIETKVLIKLSTILEQLVELVIIGDKNKENLINLSDDQKIKNQVEFFIELVDGSYWEITSKNKKFN